MYGARGRVMFHTWIGRWQGWLSLCLHGVAFWLGLLAELSAFGYSCIISSGHTHF